MEISYYVECNEIEERSFSRKMEKSCLPEKDPIDPLIGSTVQPDNNR